MNDRAGQPPGTTEASNAGSAEIDTATKRLMTALEALESAVAARHEADRDEDELATRIQALGADRSRLADELDNTLVKARRLERANRDIAERLDGTISTIQQLLAIDEAADDADEGADEAAGDPQ